MPSLNVLITGNADPFRKELNDVSKISSQAGKNMVGGVAAHAPGLNLIMRETLVVMREIGRGNWARVPGSLTLIGQGFAQLKGIALVTMGVWALAIAGIVGSFYIFHYRVTSMMKSLKETMESTFDPKHIAGYLSKLEILNQLHKDVAQTVRSVQEAHDSVAESMKRELDLTKDRISFEQQLLEMKKQNELAAAKSPAERERIEKKYSAQILAKKKEERDAEVADMRKEAALLPEEILRANNLIKQMQPSLITAGRDEEILRKRQAESAAYDDYRKQLLPGAKDTRDFSADKDRLLIETLQVKKKNYEADKANILLTGKDSLIFTSSDQAKMDAAKARLDNSAATQQSVNAWMNSKDERERARLRVKELEDKVKADEKRLAELGGNTTGKIHDTLVANAQKDREDLELEKERLKRTNSPGPARSIGPGLSQLERAGGLIAGISLVDVSKEQLRVLKNIEKQLGSTPHYSSNRGTRY